MIIIKHRVNKISQLKSVPINYGVEIDLRSNDKKIYLHHDPFRKGESFDNWLKFFDHKILVLNVKEYGIEKKIISILKKHKIKNYFFHDQSFSILVKQIKNNFSKFSIRYSEYESMNNYISLLNYIDWVWIDNFNRLPLLNKKLLKNNKIVIVSPELVEKNRKKEILKIKEFLKQNNFQIDAVCTKYPEMWQN